LTRERGLHRRHEFQRGQRKPAHDRERREVDGEKARERVGGADRQAPVERATLRESGERKRRRAFRRQCVGERVRVAQTQIEALARNRYRVFKEQTYDALVSLNQIFHYHFINAQAPLDVVQENIIRELDYQSSLELDPRTYDRLRRLPVASQIILHARQDLVRRLDDYAVDHPETLDKVIDFIEHKIMPIVVPHAISGQANINSEDTLFHDPVALAILIDVFSERGFHASVDIHRIEIPDRFDLQTGEVRCRIKKVFRFGIRFKGSEIRRG